MSAAGWREVALLSAGVMKAVDLAAEVVYRTTGQATAPYLKSAFSVALSGAAAAAYAEGWRERVLVASGVSGGSAILHEAYAVLTTRSDVHKAAVVRGRRV